MKASTLALSGIAVLSFVLAACSTSSDDPSAAESDIAQGNPNGHDEGGGCVHGGDCKSGVCTSGVCTAPKDPQADCGGASATKCGDGKSCVAAGDCASGVCTGALCHAATGSDGVKNGDESDVDCGGTTTGAPRCATGLTCGAGDDCDSKVCAPATKKCSAPRGDDGVQNGDESDVDCGGTTTAAAKCAVGKGCKVHADCATDGCDDTKHCALQRSCTQSDGGLTCGEGEVGAAGAKHESCCTSLAIPGRATRLDKYKVTAGRMRAFIDRTNGDVLGWYNASKPALSAATVAQIEPFKTYLPVDRTSYPYGAEYQVGGTSILTDRPSDSQGCYAGNAANPAVGSHTYFTSAALESEDRGFDRAFLDRLPLNCVPYPIAAAFCAWDGGRLQTFDENSTAYGPGAYPWGSSPAAGGYANVGGVWTVVGPATSSTGPCPTCDPNRLNWLNNYQFPAGGNAAKPWDFAYWISAPGRFPLDSGAGGHKDLGGVLMELTATPGTNDPKYGATVRWSRAGSWEGHPVNYGQYQFAVMTKYGKTGARCARD